MAPKTDPNAETELVIKDRHTLDLKHKMMSRLKWSGLLTSIGQMATFVAGVLMAGAVGILGASLKGVGSFAEAGAAMAGSPIGLAFLGVATAATVVAVGTNYAAARIWQNSNFDNLEINAQRVADNLVSKLKQNNMCLTEEKHDMCRKDGKTWAQYTHPQRQTALAQATRTNDG